MVDKLLLVLLVLMLPLGIVLSKQLSGKLGSEKPDPNLEAVQKTLDKIASAQQSQQTGVVEETSSPINITSIREASGAGVLQISGVAPEANRSMVVSATVLPSSMSGGTGVLGEAIELRAIKPHSDGAFIFEYPIKGVSGVIEIKLEQGKSELLIQYDVDNHKQLK